MTKYFKLIHVCNQFSADCENSQFMGMFVFVRDPPLFRGQIGNYGLLCVSLQALFPGQAPLGTHYTGIRQVKLKESLDSQSVRPAASTRT